MRHEKTITVKFKIVISTLFSRVILSMAVLSAISLTRLQAQESVNATGGEASGNGGSASYSIGQVAYQSQTGISGTVSEGVQQPYEISVVTSTGGLNGINLLVSAYPNPTTDVLMLKVDISNTLSVQSLSYQLFDMQGKLLQTKKLSGMETQIDMSTYHPSTYFVRVVKGNQSVKEFKIIKK